MTPPSDAPPTITVKAPHDLLAAAAVVLGFWPTDSVVMLTFGSAEPFHARVDLPGDPADAPALAELLLTPVLRHRVPHVVLLLFCDDAYRAQPVWRALRDRFAARQIEIIEALRADGRRWFPLLGGDRTLREIGVPYDGAAHPFLVEAVFSGRVTRSSRAELEASLDPDPDRVAAVEEHAVELASARPCLDALETPFEAVLDEAEWALALVERHIGAGSTCSDAEAARLLWGMQHLLIRDATWSVLRRDLARALVDFWADVVRRSPAWLLAAPATQLGWSAWQVGDGALAWCAIDRARSVEADYRLAGLLADVLTRAIPPSAWGQARDGDLQWDWHQDWQQDRQQKWAAERDAG